MMHVGSVGQFDVTLMTNVNDPYFAIVQKVAAFTDLRI